jgi:hypothetical protein
LIRRLILVGLAAVLAAPAFSVTPASAAVLFTCSGIDTFGQMGLSPGLSNTASAETVSVLAMGISTPCSNGETAFVVNGPNPIASYPPRPLSCPVGFGGATSFGYPDQTPILFGADGGGGALSWHWYGAAGAKAPSDSSGIFKVKAGPNPTQWRFAFIITSGAYAPPAGKKTKVKFPVSISPSTEYRCYDPYVVVGLNLNPAGSVIVQQV